MNRFRFLHITFIAPALMLTISCGDGKPSGVISEEKMQAVIWDLVMAGEYVNGYIYYQNPAQSRVVINNELLHEIYKVHGITKKELDKSLEYYKKNPKLLIAILDSVTAKHGSRATGVSADRALGGPPPSVIPSPPASPAPAPMPEFNGSNSSKLQVH